MDIELTCCNINHCWCNTMAVELPCFRMNHCLCSTMTEELKCFNRDHLLCNSMDIELTCCNVNHCRCSTMAVELPCFRTNHCLFSTMTEELKCFNTDHLLCNSIGTELTCSVWFIWMYGCRRYNESSCQNMLMNLQVAHTSNTHNRNYAKFRQLSTSQDSILHIVTKLWAGWWRNFMFIWPCIVTNFFVIKTN